MIDALSVETAEKAKQILLADKFDILSVNGCSMLTQINIDNEIIKSLESLGFARISIYPKSESYLDVKLIWRDTRTYQSPQESSK